MADLHKYKAHEILNKVLNSAETGLQVDIVSGAEYAEDSAHTSADTGNFILGVRNDTLAALGVADGDYVPFQMNADGALYVDVANGGVLESAVDGLETLLTGIDADTDAIKTDAAAIEVLLTAANVDHAANEALLTTIDADTDAIKTDMAAIEVLLTAANVDHAANEVLLTGIDADTNAIKVDMAAIEVLLTAANVDHAANEALLTTIDSDTNETKNALNNMLYGTAVAITAVDGGSDQNIQSGATYEALYIGVGGDVTVTLATDGEDILFKNLASGQLLPIRLTHVKESNTTATHMIALKA